MAELVLGVLGNGRPIQSRSLRGVRAERANVDTAIAWRASESDGPDGDGLESALRLASAMAIEWDVHGLWTHGRSVLRDLLARAESASSPVVADEARVKALHEARVAAARLALRQSDANEARELLRAVINSAEISAEPRLEAMALAGLAAAELLEGHLDAAQALFEEALEIRRATGECREQARVLGSVSLVERLRGNVERSRDLLSEALDMPDRALDESLSAWLLHELGAVVVDTDSARKCFTESLALREALEDRYGISMALAGLGLLAELDDNLDEARACIEQSLAFKRELGDLRGVAWSQDHLGRVALRSGDVALARELGMRALETRVRLRFVPGMLESLEELGDVAGARGQHERCVLLHAAVAALREEQGLARATSFAHRCMALDAARSALAPMTGSFEHAWTTGSVLALDEAVSLALEG
jgi:tetratricopeptide (TPR) repeat protein